MRTNPALLVAALGSMAFSAGGVSSRPGPVPVGPEPGWAVPYGRPPPGRDQTERIDIGRVIEGVRHAAVLHPEEGDHPTVTAGNYRAVFTRKGVVFRPFLPGPSIRAWSAFGLPARSPHGPVIDPLVSGRWETRVVRRGARVLYAGDDAGDPFVRGNTAQYRLAAGLVERYEARRDGVQQSWHFATVPAGDGDLVVDGRLEGLSFAGVTREGLHFGDGRTARVRYGTARVMDAAGRVAEVPVDEVDGGVRITVPGAWLASAQAPWVIDPLIGAELGMDAVVTVAEALGAQTQASVASDGAGFLVVWQDDRANAGTDILCARVNSGGTVLDPAGIVVSAATPTAENSPAVAWNGSQYLVAWSDNRNSATTGYDLYAARVSALGVLQDAAGIPVSTAALVQSVPVVTARGTEWLVAWQDQRNNATTGLDIYAARVSAAGAVLDPGGIAVNTEASSQTAPSAASIGTESLLAWQDFNADNDIFKARVDSGGTVLSLGAVNADGNDQIAPSVTSNGSGYLVTWQGYSNQGGGNQNVYAARVTAGGIVTDTAELVVSGPASSAQTTPVAASNGTDYLVAWVDDRNSAATGQDIHAARVQASDGAVLDATSFVVSNATLGQNAPAAAWNGTTYLVAWSDIRSGGAYDIYAARVTGTGVVSDPSGIPATGGGNPQIYPAVGTNGTGYLVAWMDGRPAVAAYDVYAVRLDATGTVLDPAGIALETSVSDASAPSIGSNGTDYLVAWENAVSGQDLFAARVRASDGAALDVPPIVVSAATGDQDVATVTSDGTDYLVVFDDTRDGEADVYGTRVSAATGAVLDTGFPVSGSGTVAESFPSAAWNGTHYLVAWMDARNGATDIFAARVLPNGTVVDGAGIAVGIATNVQELPSVASEAGAWLVAWQDKRNSATTGYDVYASSVAASGAVLNTAGTALVTATGDQVFQDLCTGFGCTFTPVMTFNATRLPGYGYLVSWKDRRNGIADVYAARVKQDGSTVDGPAASGGFLVESDASYAIHSAGVACPTRRCLSVYSEFVLAPGLNTHRAYGRILDLTCIESGTGNDGNGSVAGAEVCTIPASGSHPGREDGSAEGNTDTTDFWRYTAPSATARRFYVDITSSASFDLYVWDATGVTVLGSDAPGPGVGVGTARQVDVLLSAGQTVFAEVRYASGTSTYTIETQASPLASGGVTLTGGAEGDGNVRLQWTTDDEHDLVCFEVQRADETGSFAPITGCFPAQLTGQSAGAQYTYLDTGLSRGTYRYRLDIRHLDETDTFAGPVVVSLLPDGGDAGCSCGAASATSPLSGFLFFVALVAPVVGRRVIDLRQ